MKAIGIVLLYDRNIGAPQEVSSVFSEFFPQVTENLVKEGLLTLPELKEIIDSKSIYWGGIKENFKEFLLDEDSIGKLGWQVFNKHSGKDPLDEVKSLIYDGNKAPWNYSLVACVLYE
ncbi:MAG: hypothetical protein JW891_06910 [Candidatus Lokiarchaeota archaeon]|nr:hypothetical protein [Candidatus Lokiarchaeota archaeon]